MMDTEIRYEYSFSKLYWWWQFLALCIGLFSMIVMMLIGYINDREPGFIIVIAVLFLVLIVAFRDMFFLWPVTALIYSNDSVEVRTKMKTYTLSASDIKSVKFGKGTYIKHSKGVFIFCSSDPDLNLFVDDLVTLNPMIEVRHGLFY